VRAQRAFVQYAERIGRPVAHAGVDRDADPVTITAALDAIAEVYRNAENPPTLWVDTLQAPMVVSRHQVDVNDLLWNVRAIRHQIELPVIVSGSRVASKVAHNPDGAFYGDGAWVTLSRPGTDVWVEVARVLNPAPSPGWVRQLADITHGHPQATLLALALSTTLGTGRSSLELWQAMLSLDAGHTARAMQHARSLHRLGGDMLSNLAHGLGPYEGARTKAAQMERQRAVRGLHEGGLITQPRPRAWEITNPLVAGRLRGQTPLVSAEAGPILVADDGDPLLRALDEA